MATRMRVVAACAVEIVSAIRASAAAAYKRIAAIVTGRGSARAGAPDRTNNVRPRDLGASMSMSMSTSRRADGREAVLREPEAEVLRVGVGQAGATGGREALGSLRVALAREHRARRRRDVVDFDPRAEERACADHAVDLGLFGPKIEAQTLEIGRIIRDDGDGDLARQLEVGGAVLGFVRLTRIRVARLRACRRRNLI